MCVCVCVVCGVGVVCGMWWVRGVHVYLTYVRTPNEVKVEEIYSLLADCP